MKIGLPLVFCCIISACHSPKNQQPNVKAVSALKADSINNEYLDWDSIKVNGTISMISNYKDFVSKFGKPDSIGELSESVNGSYYHKKFRECHFKGLAFEKYRDTLVFSKMNFYQPTFFFLTCGKVKLDNNFTSQKFKKLFPASFENNHLHGTSLDKYEYISLPLSPRIRNDDWIFTFDARTGKLLSIDYDDAPDSKSEQNN